MTRPFKGVLDHWEYSKIDETGRLAELVMNKYYAHLG
jgi:mitochondrial fission protein ELM1